MDVNGSPYLPVMCDKVPQRFRLKAQRELGETKETVTNGLLKLREFLKNENYPPNNDDTFLLQFLRQQKFDFQKAEDKLKKHYHMREKTIQLYQNMDEEKFRVIIDSKVLLFLPFRDAEGRTIIVTHAKAVDFTLFSAADALKCALALFQFVSTFPLTSICGINVLGEAEYRSPIDAMKIFNESRKYIWIENSCPFRIQRADFFNVNIIFQYLWMGLRPFLPSKLTKRTSLHGYDKDVILQIYHPSIIPDEFGGSLGPLSSDGFKEDFLRYVRKLKAECHLYQRRD